MSDATQAPQPKDPAPIVFFKAQVSNKAAERLGQVALPFFFLLILITTSLLAFPFINEKFVTATQSTNPDRYPGLPEALVELARQGLDVRVDATGLVCGPGVPPEARVGNWLFLFEPAGAKAEKFASEMQARDDLSLFFFGKANIGAWGASQSAMYEGSLKGLQGFELKHFLENDPAKLLTIVLYSAATVDIQASFAQVWFLMFVQVVSMSLIMGFLLSLSKVHIQGTGLGAVRGAGFVSSLKTVIGVSVGPALLLAVLSYLFTGLGSLSWMVFSVLFAGRIVLIYMARFKNKKKKA